MPDPGPDFLPIYYNLREVNILVPENKIITYLLLTALMVITFACAIVISNTAYSTLGWIGLLLLNLGTLIYLLLK